MRKQGFSLIELLVVISLFIFIITITYPRLSFINNQLLTAEIEKLYTTFSFLQQKAIASNEKQELIFTTTNNSYTYKYAGKSFTHTFPNQIKFGYLKNSNGPPSSPSKLITQAITFRSKNNLNKANFFSNGKISPGTAYLIDKEEKFMKALTCPISQVSYIRKYFYQDYKWYTFEHHIK